MDKKAVFNHYSEILNRLLDESNFLKFYLQNPYFLEGKVFIDDVIRFCYGATRGCFVDDNYDYVVKFDIEMDGDGESCCAREVEIYDKAKTKGLDSYFCEAEYLGTYTHNFKFYTFEAMESAFGCCPDGWNDFDGLFMDKLDDFGEIKTICVYGYRRAEIIPGPTNKFCDEVVKSIRSPFRGNYDVATSFYYEYGWDEYVEFSRFALHNHINDLHRGNIGYINNRMCLIDYAGFHDMYEEEDEDEDEDYMEDED